jgi:hypothetical protein
LLKAYGPVERLPRWLPHDAGIREAFVFGSWAARYTGEAGPLPRDLDLLFVLAPKADVRAIDEACALAEAELGLEVQPTMVDEREWETADSGFLRAVKDGPLVPLELES